MNKSEDKDERIAVVFVGEGGAQNGRMAECLNAAAKENLPILFCVIDNGRAINTFTQDVAANQAVYKMGEHYGIPGTIVDGQNLTDVLKVGRSVINHVRKTGPAILQVCPKPKSSQVVMEWVSLEPGRVCRASFFSKWLAFLYGRFTHSVSMDTRLLILSMSATVRLRSVGHAPRLIRSRSLRLVMSSRPSTPLTARIRLYQSCRLLLTLLRCVRSLHAFLSGA